MQDYDSLVLAPFHQTTDHPMDLTCSLFSCITFLALLGPFLVLLDMNSKKLKVREGKQKLLFAFLKRELKCWGQWGEFLM